MRRARIHRDRWTGQWVTTLFHPGGYPAASPVSLSWRSARLVALAWVGLWSA